MVSDTPIQPPPWLNAPPVDPYPYEETHDLRVGPDLHPALLGLLPRWIRRRRLGIDGSNTPLSVSLIVHWWSLVLLAASHRGIGDSGSGRCRRLALWCHSECSGRGTRWEPRHLQLHGRLAGRQT